MLSASTGGGRGPGATLEQRRQHRRVGAQQVGGHLGPEPRSSAASAVSSASSGMARSSGPHDAISTVSPAAARRSAQVRSRVVLPMPASPSTTTTSTRAARAARAATASR